MSTRTRIAAIFLLALSLLMVSSLLAQDEATEEPAPPLSLTGIDPQQVTGGQSTSVNLLGSGFSEETSAQLSGLGEIDPNFVSETMLSITLPDSLAAGSYDVTVSNPEGEVASLPAALRVDEPPPPPISITQVEPQRLTTGQQATLSILGSNFTSASIVRVVGVGLLQTTFVNSGALTAVLPSNVAAGRYGLEVSDPNGGSASIADALTLVTPPPPPTTPPPPPPSPTPQVVVNKPALALTNFVAQPATIEPGQTVNLSFNVSNLGTQTARTIVVSLGTGSSFVPAGGQSSLTLPDLPARTAISSRMAVSVALDVADGPVRIPVTVSYQDPAGERYTTDAELSVTVRSVATNSQLVIDAYAADPSPAEPGEAITLRLTVANLGNETASQLSLRFSSAENVLLPNGSGDTFFVGDIQPGQRVPLQAALIVSTEAEDGPQVQPITMTYMQDGESKESATSITVNVAEVNQPQPLLLLSQYSTSEETLQPGSRFNLGVTLQNAGAADARSVMLTFGTVQSTGGNNGGDDGSDGDGNGGGQSSTPSTTFAPLGTAGLAYIGDISSGGSVEVNQEFLVAGSVSSGIYNLPITLQYTQPDNSAKQSLVNVSLVVIVPPRLRVSLPAPLPDSVNTGEGLMLELELFNEGRTDLNLTSATVSAENAEISEGAENRLERLKSDDDARLSALVIPQEEGQVDITVTINYLNDLNQPGSIVHTYTLDAVMPPPPPEEPIDQGPVIEEPQPEPDWLGQALLALLGLGS